MREFRKITGRTSRPIVWKIGIDPKDPKTYIVTWGLQDGAMQETQDTPGPCGTKGHANYQTAEEYVQFCIDREIRKKTEQGFVEYEDGEPLTKAASKIDFSKPLPKNLCFYKPKKDISDKALKKLEADDRVTWTLKRDGMMHIVVKREDEIEIYSRRMDLVTAKFPHIVDAVENLSLPNDTILLGEMCLLRDDGSESFLGTSRICRSDPDLALAYQGLADFPKRKKNESVLGKVSYYVFDMAFFQGIDLISTIPTKKRLVMLREIFKRLNKNLTIGTGRFANLKQIMRESL
jgi:ATP-dependent DNA ligase